MVIIFPLDIIILCLTYRWFVFLVSILSNEAIYYLILSLSYFNHSLLLRCVFFSLSVLWLWLLFLLLFYYFICRRRRRQRQLLMLLLLLLVCNARDWELVYAWRPSISIHLLVDRVRACFFIQLHKAQFQAMCVNATIYTL